MRNVLVASYDMEVGGVERSLAGMLDQFDYASHAVDLMLYRHQGDFMPLLSGNVNLLGEVAEYATFRKSIGETLRDRQLPIGIARVLSRVHARLLGSWKRIAEPGYIQQQLMWKYALPFLPKTETEYDVAISYLWPHYYVAEKVKAGKKVAWIHTDFSTVETNRAMDLKMWNKFDHIIAVSDACKASFLAKYGSLSAKVTVIENIMSPEFVKGMAAENDPDNAMKADKRFKLLTVARLSHAKGIDQAVKACKHLADRGYDRIAWYVVGYGGDEGMIRELIAQYGLEERFILLGKQTNPYPFIRECDLYVQPSRYEGKAVTVTEAKILGKPIVITDYATSASQVVDGVDGVICELSPEGIARAVERLYHDEELRKRLARYLDGQDYGNGGELDKLYQLLA
ncbi:glycosyltransferase [Paenibacillus arenilitoris]|uniref:Glycosyltransferase n=1 Tax=Paenibacillus arenilitoris TaxID=2772299 RepID=A0A927CPZ8_9BACL|nr:glycosyltransferase [Paenibacillus arenilitoris]MBD2872039.1 glycosyltransferase [Paenibacillus arenilitoris]